MFFDAALILETDALACDLALADDGDLAIDQTPATPMLLSIGLDRRALSSDALPDGRTEWTPNPASLLERRGAPTDGLDINGDFAGSRLWLLNRSKATESVRLLNEYYAAEALAWAKDMTGEAAEVEASWFARNTLKLKCSVAGDVINIMRRASQ